MVFTNTTTDGVRPSQLDHDDHDDHCEVLPVQYQAVSVRCIQESTFTLLCHYLDPCNDHLNSLELTKDYRGLAELCLLKPVKMRYVTDKEERTKRILKFWQDDQPQGATLGKLWDFVQKLERYDVLTDCFNRIVRDAEAWLNRKQRPKAVSPTLELTMHDRAIDDHEETYTACLCAAEEDVEMTSLFEELYADVPELTFFYPPRDLVYGHYEFGGTATVIKKRCGGRVIFFVSDSFHDTEACTFCVNYTKTLDPGSKKGLLIPFILTETEVPPVLAGIWGIKWTKVASRKNSLLRLTDFLLMNFPDQERRHIRGHIKEKLEADPERWQIGIRTPPIDHPPHNHQQSQTVNDQRSEITSVDSSVKSSSRHLSPPSRTVKSSSVFQKLYRFFRKDSAPSNSPSLSHSCQTSPQVSSSNHGNSQGLLEVGQTASRKDAQMCTVSEQDSTMASVKDGRHSEINCEMVTENCVHMSRHSAECETTCPSLKEDNSGIDCNSRKEQSGVTSVLYDCSKIDAHALNFQTEDSGVYDTVNIRDHGVPVEDSGIYENDFSTRTEDSDLELCS